MLKNCDKILPLLRKQPYEVLRHICKLVLEYTKKGPSKELYLASSRKLQIDYKIIEELVESLVFLITECCKNKVNEEDFEKYVADEKFSNDQSLLLCALYSRTNPIFAKVLAEHSGSVLPYFSDLQWRFESTIGSRALLDQITPTIALNLKTSSSPHAGKGEICNNLMQVDPKTLFRMTESLEKALQFAQSSSSKKRNVQLEVSSIWEES